MWVLLIMIMTSGPEPEIVAYDQGWYTSWSECRDIGKATVKDLDNKYNFTCVEWKRKK